MPSIIEKYPDHARLLGTIIAEWAVVEIGLMFVMRYILDVDQSRAVMLFNSFVSFRAKADFIERLTHTYTKDSEARSELLQLIGESKRLVSLRNKFAHCAWAAEKNSDKLLIIPNSVPSRTDRKTRPSENVSTDDLQDVHTEIAQLADTLARFPSDIAPRLTVHS